MKVNHEGLLSDSVADDNGPAAEEEDDEGNDHDAPKSAMRTGVKKEDLKLSVYNGRDEVTMKELFKANMSHRRFGQLCKMAKLNTNAPCFFCMIGRCTEKSHKLEKLESEYVHIFCLMIRELMSDNELTVRTGKIEIIKTDSSKSLKALKEILFSGERSEDKKKEGPVRGSVEVSGGKRVALFVLKNIGERMAPACRPWASAADTSGVLVECGHCNGLHVVGCQTSGKDSCPCGSYNRFMKKTYPTCSFNGDNCLTNVALKHEVGQIAILKSGVSRDDLRVVLQDMGFQITPAATKLSANSAAQEKRANRVKSKSSAPPTPTAPLPK